ncbi:flagellar hook-length control protein FliK [Limimaricola soesokkakensis]|uniref:Flagellar hook-length control protein FliK n=2 Tax=Limimaricola soesokkakensis TaxID=1343159 RepID=A0A1X7A6I1_9RHOB|nr:flagellar hook-length control protein FliK [Limimaricola soesokkakensis]PSK80335.1 flagellar hook-length control protein FliK [Limimaricola soesokkakensis]SLN71911.1 Flagellar hook-length control protein FliK [Limimaricola soesokkakensis]
MFPTPLTQNAASSGTAHGAAMRGGTAGDPAAFEAMLASSRDTGAPSRPAAPPPAQPYERLFEAAAKLMEKGTASLDEAGEDPVARAASLSETDAALRDLLADFDAAHGTDISARLNDLPGAEDMTAAPDETIAGLAGILSELSGKPMGDLAATLPAWSAVPAATSGADGWSRVTGAAAAQASGRSAAPGPSTPEPVSPLGEAGHVSLRPSNATLADDTRMGPLTASAGAETAMPLQMRIGATPGGQIAMPSTQTASMGQMTLPGEQLPAQAGQAAIQSAQAAAIAPLANGQPTMPAAPSRQAVLATGPAPARGIPGLRLAAQGDQVAAASDATEVAGRDAEPMVTVEAATLTRRGFAALLGEALAQQSGIGPEAAEPTLREPVTVEAAQSAPRTLDAGVTSRAPLEPQAPPPPAAPQLASGFSRAVASQIRNATLNDGVTRISLTPGGIGEIEIDLTQEDGQLRVVIRAENQGVLQALRGDREGLVALLGNEGAGFDESQLSFESFDRGNGGDRGDGRPTAVPAIENDAETDPVTGPATPSGGGAGRLDMLT